MANQSINENEIKQEKGRWRKKNIETNRRTKEKYWSNVWSTHNPEWTKLCLGKIKSNENKKQS